jgi:hypothetical protein
MKKKGDLTGPSVKSGSKGHPWLLYIDGGRNGHDNMVVGYTTTCATSACHH